MLRTTTYRRTRPATDRKPETMILRCALYAGYSFDQQGAASIKDRLRGCREHAGRMDRKVAGAAISGDSVILRPGIQGFLDDARRGMFEIVVAEAPDGVSRA